ncbi:MAG: FHA domain-containing protein [Solirubrobacteraceae bacterium]|jgi:predicted  nucleic acid-binding Zn-ribbon protein
MESLTSGTMAGAGSFRCEHCGYMLTLAGTDTLSDCPGCGGRDFVRASLFSAGGLARGRSASTTLAGGVSGGPGGPILASRGTSGVIGAGASLSGARATDADTLNAGIAGGVLSQPEPVDSDAWLEDAREQLQEPGEYLAYEDGDIVKTVALTREWTRIGRSLAADVRFDDPTVSRRHALVVRQPDGVRVLDDRSLNGVFVNGSRIEWKVLQDGDEIVVGRYRLRFLSVAAVTGETPSSQTLHSAS